MGTVRGVNEGREQRSAAKVQRDALRPQNPTPYHTAPYHCIPLPGPEIQGLHSTNPGPLSSTSNPSPQGSRLPVSLPQREPMSCPHPLASVSPLLKAQASLALGASSGTLGGWVTRDVSLSWKLMSMGVYG